LYAATHVGKWEPENRLSGEGDGGFCKTVPRSDNEGSEHQNELCTCKPTCFSHEFGNLLQFKFTLNLKELFSLFKTFDCSLFFDEHTRNKVYGGSWFQSSQVEEKLQNPLYKSHVKVSKALEAVL